MHNNDVKKQVQSLIDACNWVLSNRCGGSKTLADILLSCYNGPAYPCGLGGIKNFDHIRIEWVLDIITLHAHIRGEIHELIKDGHKVFQAIVKEYKTNSDTTNE